MPFALIALAVLVLPSAPGETPSTTTSTGADGDAGMKTVPPYYPSLFSLHHPSYVVLGDQAGQAKVQLSLRYGLLTIGERVSVEFAYTQRSYWAVFDRSTPFRETNYLPEAFVDVRLSPCVEPAIGAIGFAITRWTELRKRDAEACRAEGPGLVLSKLRVGIEHTSNGTANPLSRAWNRVYAEVSLELSDRSGPTPPDRDPLGDPAGPFLRITPRAWIPVLVSGNNENITDYAGYADLELEAGTARESFGRVVLEIAGAKGVGSARAGWLRSSLFWQPWGDGYRPWIDLEWWLGYGERLLRYDRGDNLLRVGLGFRGFG